MTIRRPRKTNRPPKRRAAQRGTPTAASQSVNALLNELRIHAEMITVQNEQLLKAQSEIEEARDRFADLYDFAPVVYLAIDHRGVIADINLAGETLFGRDRASLLNQPLSSMILREYRPALEEFLYLARHPESVGNRTLEVMAKTGAHKVLRLIARRHPTTSGVIFMAAVDITEERRLANERRIALEHEQQRARELQREITERTAAEARVKALLERLVTAQEEERRRMARNLHDHLGQQMTALHLTLSALGEDGSLSPEAARRLLVAEGIVTKLDRDIDLLAWDLRPAALSDIGLSSALADLARQWTSVTEIPAEFHESTPHDLVVPPETAANLYRIIQEALNNVAKHAGASHVSILLETRGEETIVIVEDDGRGFDPERQEESQPLHAGMGLIGMRERAALIDGDLQIESKPGHGTTIFVRVPLKGAGRAAEAGNGADQASSAKRRGK